MIANTCSTHGILQTTKSYHHRAFVVFFAEKAKLIRADNEVFLSYWIGKVRKLWSGSKMNTVLVCESLVIGLSNGIDRSKTNSKFEHLYR